MDLYASADTYLARWSATTNYGASGSLNVRYNSASAWEEFSALVRFDLSAIPAGAVQAAQLTLTVTNSPASWLDLDVFQVYRPWTESGATWNVWQAGANWSPTLAVVQGAGYRHLGSRIEGNTGKRYQRRTGVANFQA